MVKRFVGGITIGTPDSTTIGTNARGIFTGDSLVQSTSISTGSVAGIYGGTPTANATSATYVLVGGGQSGSTCYAGTGAVGNGDFGAGGGGGEILQNTLSGITAGVALTITIGGGGSAPSPTTNPGANGAVGGNTIFSTVTSRGGGVTFPGYWYNGRGGNSGGNNAGTGDVQSSSGVGGGGGGGGAAFAPIVTGSQKSGDGGIGATVTLGPLTSEFSGGGGGGFYSGPGAGRGGGYTGGHGGFGNAGDIAAAGRNGVVNTGGGGGGRALGSVSRAACTPGNGGSGRAWIRVLIYDGTTTYYTPAATGTYNQINYTSGGNGYVLFDFTGSGTLTF